MHGVKYLPLYCIVFLHAIIAQFASKHNDIAIVDRQDVSPPETGNFNLMTAPVFTLTF